MASVGCGEGGLCKGLCLQPPFSYTEKWNFHFVGAFAETSGWAPQAVTGTVVCVHHIRQQKEMLCVEPLPRSQFPAQGSVCHLTLWSLLKWLNICLVSGNACDPPAQRAVNDCKELGQGRRGWRNCSAGRGTGALLMSCAKSSFQQLLMNSMSTASWLGNSWGSQIC